MNRKLQLIGRFFKGARGYFITAVAASLCMTLLNSLTPQIFRFTIDAVLGTEQYPYLAEHLWIMALLLIGTALLSGLFMFVCRYHTAKAGENFAENMRNALFTHVQKLPMSWHDRNQTGDIIQRCTSDVEVIRNFVVKQMLEVFRTAFLILVSFGMMLSMNRKLSLIVLGFVPVIVAYSAVFYRLIARRFTDADEAEGALSTVVQENATGVRVVRAFGREKFEMDRFREKNDAFAELWIKLGTLSGLYWGVGDLITGLLVIVVIVLGAIEAVQGTVTVGEFVAFASYTSTLVWPVRGLGRILSDMSKAGVSFERVDYIIKAEEEAYESEGVQKDAVGQSQTKSGEKRAFGESDTVHTFDIAFEHVNFSYEDSQPVLKDVSFRIPQGTTLGILGGTGSGKSTITQLLTRFYELDRVHQDCRPDSISEDSKQNLRQEEAGIIRIGGKDIRDIPLEELRRHVGIVLQEPFLYSRTIKENIAAANPEATMEEIRHAAKIACVDDTIMKFPDGYDTLVGERGVTLSGGQRQRVAIARMLLQKAPIMIFDDSLSAVDSETDSLIRKALKEQMKDATVIIISHRITTLMSASNIMVLHQGEIREMGTHQELIRQDGIYRRIYEIQMSHDDRREVTADNGSV